MDRVGCATFAEALLAHAALQPRSSSPLGLGIRKLCLSCRGDEARKGRSVAKLERGPKVLRLANSAGGYLRDLLVWSQGASVQLHQACGEIRHRGSSKHAGV